MYKKFMIIVVNLDPRVGHEVKKRRPCVIISPDEMNNSVKTVTVAPLTSTERKIPTRIMIKASNESGLDNDSYVMLDQITTIDQSRVEKIIGSVSDSEEQDITDGLLELFAR